MAWDLIRHPDSGDPDPDPALAALPRLVGGLDAVAFWLLGARSQVTRATVAEVLAKAPPSALRVVDVGLRQNFYDAATVDWALRQVHVAKLNADELAAATALLGLGPTPESLAGAYDLDTLIVTRGAAGATSLRAGRSTEVPAARVPHFVDAVGCGDAFLAGYLHARLSGHGEEDCLRAGARRGAYAAGLRGGLPPDPDGEPPQQQA